jgi:LPS export ABC transporter protein LptC
LKGERVYKPRDMKINKKTGFVAAVAVVFILAAIVLFMGQGRDASKSALKVMAENVDLQVKNILLTEVGGAGEKWEIKAETAQYKRKENLALFDKVTVKLVMADGKTFIMTGDKGKFMTETKDMEISGNVVITSEQGDRFTTDQMKYSYKDKKVYSDGNVTMDNARMTVTGVGMNLLMNEKKIKILSNVKVVTK